MMNDDVVIPIPFYDSIKPAGLILRGVFEFGKEAGDQSRGLIEPRTRLTFSIEHYG